MATASASLDRDIVSLLHRVGYVLLPAWRPSDTTAAVANSIGTIVNIDSLLPGTDIPTVQTLMPRCETTASLNEYSGTFGLNEFPFHSDLAHWVRPPRYLMLRCLNGSPTVATKVLNSSILTSVLGTKTLRKALARPRRVNPTTALCLLPLAFSVGGVDGLRWDPLFLVPMNSVARRVAELMHTQVWQFSEHLTLVKRGDTLIIDNWRVLHGRSEVARLDIDRRVERVYLSELHV